MKILTLETTGKYASASVADENGTIAACSSSEEMSHLKEILTLSDAALEAAGTTLGELTHVAASAGPGSFTGIRIGVTTARTLAQMLGIPCIAVSSLEGLGERALADADKTGCDTVMTIINARRHQVYGAVWSIADEPDKTGCRLTEKVAPAQYMIEELTEMLLGDKASGNVAKVYIIGDGIDAYSDIIKEKLGNQPYVLAPAEVRYQDAEDVAECAVRKALAGMDVPYSEMLPDYMRLSEAEQRLRDGTLSSRIGRQQG